MVAEDGIKNVNLYDLFANIVPGLTFIFGIIIPFEISPLIKGIFGENVEFSFNLSYLFLLITISFVVGQLLQAFGSRFDGDHGFSDFIQEIRGNTEQSRYDMTEFDDVLWEFCRVKFFLSDSFDSYDRLFKAILSFLEKSQRNRALRLQALYLFARGVFVASMLLFLYYSVILTSIYYNYIPVKYTSYFRPQWVMIVSTISSAITAYVVYIERHELESDWVTYTITEFYLEFIDQ